MDTMKSDVLVKPEPEETVSDSDLNRLNEDSQIEYTMEEQYKCDLCEKAFNKRLSLVCHRTSHSEKYRCDLCTKTFRQKNSFVNHKKYLCGNVEEQYSCYICKKVFPRKETLVYHIKSQHESEKFGCDLCKKKFNREETLERHKEWHNIERTVEKYTPEFKVDAVKRVREIGVTEAAKQLFVDKTSLKRWTRYIFNPLFCSFCGKGFGEQNALKIHEEGHQNQLKHYQCDKCSKMFACSTDLQFACWLKLHMKACPGNLERKERKPTKKRKRKYEKNHQCDKCSKLFPRPSALNRHMKICSDLKSDSKTYQYQCDKCPKSFASPYTLKYHKQACSGTADYNQDPIIDKQFIQTVVQLANETSVSNSCQVYKLNYARVYGWVSQHNSPDKHKCEICHKIFAHRDEHMETHKKVGQPPAEETEEEEEVQEEASFEGSFEKLMQHYPEKNKANPNLTPDLRELYLQKYSAVEENMNKPGERKHNEIKDDDSIDGKYSIKISEKTDAVAMLENVGESYKQICETGSKNTENSCNDRNTGNDDSEVYHDIATVEEEMYLDAQTIEEELSLQRKEKAIDEEMCLDDKIIKKELSLEQKSVTEQIFVRQQMMAENIKSHFKEEENTVDIVELTLDIDEGADPHYSMCDQCAFVTKSLKGLKQHKTTQHLDILSGNVFIKQEQVNDTKNIFEENDDNIKIEENFNGRFRKEKRKNGLANTICKICLKSFTNKRGCREHFRNVHLKEKNFACGVCNKMFFTKSKLDRHNSQVHKNFSCEFCNKKFPKKVTLTVHRREHTVEKPYQCENCDECFVNENRLIRHMESHLEIKDYLCIDCGNLYGSTKSLQLHVKSTHRQLFPCSICPKKFNQKTNLRTHMNWHLGIKDFQCNDCGKLFTRENTLKEHEAIVHLLSNEAFQCNTCGKEYKNKRSFKAHKKTHVEIVHHHNNEVFPCNICGKEFKYKPNLGTHIKTHLGIKRRKETKDFRCNDCDKQFTRDKCLQEHISIVHHGRRDFNCHECGKSFTRLPSLKVHQNLKKHGQDNNILNSEGSENPEISK